MKIQFLKKQLGQAIPLGIALFLVLGVASFVFMNTGQTVSDKTRIVNTADSAAYSGLVWQARAMNFTAYTNRAMVANQVAMAQAVSLHSWSGYLARTGENLDFVLGKIPFIGVVTGILKAVSGVIDAFLTPISEGMLSVINTINSGFSVAQEAMYLATFAATTDVVDSVVTSNDTRNQDFKWETAYTLMNTALNLDQWKGFTTEYGKEDVPEVVERGKMVQLSLDKFSQKREWKFFGFFLPVNPLYWVRLEKHGTTELFGSNNGDTWEIHANDAVSLRQKFYTWKGKKYYDLPIGGASSLANTTGSHETVLPANPNFHGNRHGLAKKRIDYGSSPLAPHDMRSMSGYDGMQAYRALTSEIREEEAFPTLEFSVEITMSPDDIDSAEDIYSGGQGTLFTHKIDNPNGVISSISSSELYFERPCLTASGVCDTTGDYADSYSPYWEVRLTKNKKMNRLAAYALHGVGETTDFHSTSGLAESNVSELADYESSNSNPVSDYDDQFEQGEITNQTIDGYLASLEDGTPEFEEFRNMRANITSNMAAGIPDIANEYLNVNLDEGEIAQRLAIAAGFDFDQQQFNAIKGVVDDIYGDLTDIKEMVDLEAEFRDMLEDTADEIVDDIKTELTDKLADAVTDIMRNLVVGAVQNHTGLDIDADLAAQVVEAEVRDVLNTDYVDPDDPTAIPVDLNNPCSMYGAINEAEIKVENLQIAMETANQNIATRFHESLIVISADTEDEIALKRAEIEVLRLRIQNASYSDLEPNQSMDDYRSSLRITIGEIADSIPPLYDDRVDDLVVELQRITNEETNSIPEFDDFRLDDRFARQAVIATIGDIRDLEVEDDGESVSDNLFFAEGENEMPSDSEQSFTEAPEGC